MEGLRGKTGMQEMLRDLWETEGLKGKLGMHWKTSGVAGKLGALLENPEFCWKTRGIFYWKIQWSAPKSENLSQNLRVCPKI